ncbi:sodium:solute symporter [Siminovitchia sp. FSL H7-0308]|uniref:SSS family solute:Na+ symporter n=1 Tax=Siminovitchia thermophila TaxID=1245522 RepID=A0ABS2R4L6_9BACI|nr:sodium:solute symporter [Siminovitchia thermophila]MBM7714099.1 SSS family solute:Na+ symporter [Siminovitchia thermophila]ONK21690.1 sodium:solute symporter [Bacillus sp. VT-16-64]
MNFNTLDVAIMIAYLLLLVIVGIIGSRRAKTSEDYVLAGRNLGFFMYFGCLGAVILGGASTIGSTKLGYEFGISGMWLVVMLGLGIMLLGIFLAKKISNLSVMTISEYLSKRFGVEAGLVSAVIAATYAMMVSVTQVIGMGTILNVLLGWNLTVSMLVGGGVVLFYTILGGMWSVTMTDIVQFIIMTIGVFFIMLPLGLSKAGGWSNLQSQLPDTYFTFTGIGGQEIFQYFLLFALGMVVAQDIWQRILTAKTIKIARAGTVAAGVYSLLYGVAVAIIGMCAFVILPNLEDTQNTFASMAVAILPSGVLGLVIAAVVSALMSTASGTLLASSTLISNDIIKRFFLKNITDDQYLALSRVVTTVIGILTIVCALWIQDVLVALDVAYAVLSGGIFAPVILGLFWKKATAKAAFYAIIASTAVILAGLAIEGITSTAPIIYGIAVSFVVMITVSIWSPNKGKEVDLNVKEM